MGFMLLALEVLQVFWTYYIIVAFIEISVSSKIAKNTYEEWVLWFLTPFHIDLWRLLNLIGLAQFVWKTMEF